MTPGSCDSGYHPDDERSACWKSAHAAASPKEPTTMVGSYGGLDVRSHYMRVAISYDTKQISTKIVESRNLKQSSGRIHRKANAWLAKLETKIRVALGQVAFASTRFQ